MQTSQSARSSYRLYDIIHVIILMLLPVPHFLNPGFAPRGGVVNYCNISAAKPTSVTAQSFKSPRAFYSHNCQPLNQLRQSSVMSHDHRARDCRLRVFLVTQHTTVYSVPVTCKMNTAVHYNVSCLNVNCLN